MKYCFTITTFLISMTMGIAQELPYKQIPEAPQEYTAGNVISRTIDGLGYRYYWATEGLTVSDLSYEPGNEGRSSSHVLDHLHGLSETIANAVKGLPNIRPRVDTDMSWEEIRSSTLYNLKSASDLIRTLSSEDISMLKIDFKRGDKVSSFDYWLMLNGPIADALTHVGQIVSYRRSAGNPIDTKVNVFLGKNRE